MPSVKLLAVGLTCCTLALYLSGCANSGPKPAQSDNDAASWSSYAAQRAAANKSKLAELEAEASDAAANASATATSSPGSTGPDPPAAAQPFTFTGSVDDYTQPQVTFQSLAEVWAAHQPFTTCNVEIDPAYQPTPIDLTAVALYRKFVADETPTGAMSTMLEICAMSGANQEDILRWQPTVIKGALTLCPNAPQAGLMGPWANGALIEDGTHVVGQDMQPGTWHTDPGVQNCYWERTTGGGGTIANNFVSFAPNGITVTVYASDGGFVTQGCGYWHLG